MKYALKIASPFLLCYTLGSYLLYKIRKRNSDFDHFVFRKAFIATNGITNNIISRWISKGNEHEIGQPQEGLFAGIELEGFQREMKKNGFFVFDKILPPSVLDAIYADLEKINPQKLDIKLKKYVDDSSFPGKIDSPRYQYKMADLLELESVKRICQDPSIASLAKVYLKAKPIMDLAACWWSYPTQENLAKSAAAQMYHFDMDRIKFIKFFFYLTDVDEQTGPHCYIQGSHRHLPFNFQDERRFSDEEVHRYFPEREKVLTGKKGTILAVDTRGLHKGLELTRGHRLLLQLEFSNSLFGKNY